MSMSNATNNLNSQGNYADVNGMSMYYEVHGAGYPLVLIHGGGSTLYTTFGKILPMLALKYKVIGVELQAHGHTADRDAPETFEQDADDVAALLVHLGIERADVFGFSNGANTAMQVAVRHPNAVRKLILASAFYKRAGMQAGFWEFMKHASLEYMPKVYQDEYLRINNSQTGLQAMHDRDATRMQTFTDWADDVLISIKAPALLIVGDQDVMSVEHTVEMHRLLANSRLAVLPANHGSYMGEVMSPDPESKVPELFVTMLCEFLAGPMPANE